MTLHRNAGRFCATALLILALSSEAAANSLDQKSLSEIDSELSRTQLPIHHYSPGVRVFGEKRQDDIRTMIKDLSDRRLPEIRVRTLLGWLSVSNCRQFFETSLIGRIEVDRGETDWYHFGSCDSDYALTILRDPDTMTFHPNKALREVIISVPILSFGLPSRIQEFVKSYSPDATILKLWPHSDHEPEFRLESMRHADANKVKLLYKWGWIYFSIVGFGDFNHDGIDDMLIVTSVRERPRRDVVCLHDTLSRVTRLKPDGPLSVHRIAHTHNRCAGPGPHLSSPY